MANGLYVAYKNRLLGTGTAVDWDTDTMTVLLVDTADYAVNLTTHDFVDDVAAGARVATGVLDSVAIASGAVDAADEVFSSVTGDQSEALVIYKDLGGAESADPLCVYIDTFSSGMPVTPNGGNITITWHASGIFGF